jgi:tRNA(His) 5'-end guanylyltransferase
MKLDAPDVFLRRFETAHDHSVLPGMHMVARLDGRSFTRLTKETHHFEAPFDEVFRDHMTAVVSHLLRGGFDIIYGYTQSDEISLLFRRDTVLFDRKLRKLNSLLAAEASAVLSLRLGGVACFDCRICQFPAPELVRDYFQWRQEDASRNALNAHCYWLLRREGKTPREATAQLEHLGTAGKNELLHQHGINYNTLPAWQKRGTGLYWQTHEKDGFNPRRGEATKTLRREIFADVNLPMKTAYDTFLEARLQEADAGTKVKAKRH